MTATATPDAEKTPLFGEEEKRVVLDPMWDKNPISTQMLGICSALAVTTGLKVSIVMGISVICVMAMANVAISLLRNLIPSKIRIVVQLVVVSGAVIIVDQVLKEKGGERYFLFVTEGVTKCKLPRVDKKQFCFDRMKYMQF